MKYKLQAGTNNRIYYILSIDDEGKMTLTFYGTDRTIVDDAELSSNGWIVGKGFMFPPLNNPRWKKIED